MDRRGFLRSAGGVALLAATAGCLEAELEAAEQEPEPLAARFSHEDVDLPVRQRLAIAGDDVQTAVDAGVEDLEAFEAHLAERMTVETVESAEVDGDPTVEVEYVAGDTTDGGFLDRMGHVAGGYAALVDAGAEYELLEATVLEPAGQPYGSFDAERAWAEAFLADETSAREYAGEVLRTAESSTE